MQPDESPMIAVGQTVGNYTLTAKLGEGGMGVVYLAEHPVIGRKVALKAIHPELSRNPEVVSRFVTEAKAVNQIGNEHIVDIHDFGNTTSGEFYFIMEFLQGLALSDVLKNDAPMPPERAFAIATQVADALSASHQHGIIHRDLKPENIFLITKGQAHDFVKVLDFGLAKLTQGEDKISHKTRTGSVMGTPYYMSPEQCEGKANIDHRTDVYSLGVILFEMLTGRVPYSGEGYGEIIVKHITSPIPSARALNPKLQAVHEAILIRVLAKTRDARFQSMDELSSALRNPKEYARTAPITATLTPLSGAAHDVPAAVPRDRADSVVSGQVLFGGSDVPRKLEAALAPSTSLSADLSDEALDSIGRPRRRKLWMALLAVALAAGAAAFYLPRMKAAPPPPAVKTATPKTVKLSFQSEPPGAKVIRKDTGETLGNTPFEVAVAAQTTATEFTFQMDAHQEATQFFVPDVSGTIRATLAPLPPPPPQTGPAEEPEAPSTETASPADKEKKVAKASPKKQPTRARKKHRSLDEDGVLAPSF